MNIPVVIFVVGFLAALVLALFHKSRFKPVSALVALISVLALVSGAWLVIDTSAEIAVARAVKKWPTVFGRILKTEVIGNRAIRPLVLYEYRVQDSTYRDSSSLGVPSFGNRRVRLNESETIASEYRAGDSVKVYYDPERPGRSTLYSREDWSSYMRLSVGAIFFSASLYFLFRFGLTGRARRKA